MADLKRTEFLRLHPMCCFCGGRKRATTLDHQPSRLFFRKREWPEGFVFPACGQCNDVSRTAEKAMGVLIHGERQAHCRDRYRTNLKSLSGEFPDEVRRMLVGPREKRRIMRGMGIDLPKGQTFQEFPLVKLPYDFWRPHFEMVARKILLALHYQCFGRAIPREGGVQIHIRTNAEVQSEGFCEEIMREAKFLVIPTRNRKPLADQFAIRYNVTEDAESALFVVKIHDQIVIEGITAADLSIFDSAIEDFQRPFRCAE